MMLKLFKVLHNGAQKYACKECDYYIAENGTCIGKEFQSEVHMLLTLTERIAIRITV